MIRERILVDHALVREVDLLCLDAGNTVIFLEHAAVAAALEREGCSVTVEKLVEAEGFAKRALGTPEARPAPEGFEGPAALWAIVVRTMIERAGVRESESARCVRALWAEHDRLNLWRRVPEALPEALDRVRAAGVRVCIVSNSEGKLASLFDHLGLSSRFDHVIDSALVGVEKPDPRIFQQALERFRTPAARALHLGDTIATDIVGARRAGIRCALIDPFAHYEGRCPDVPRVPDVATVIEEILQSRE
jgi:HAD superfamily hydrolase (TIGR01509 family)